MRLIESHRRGQPSALNELFAIYDPQIRRNLVRLGVPASEIEDLAQDVHLRLFKNLDRFRGQSAFYTWLYRITINVSLDHAKKRKRADARQVRILTSIAGTDLNRLEEENPFERYQDGLYRDALTEAIDALPASFRSVINMRQEQDLSYDDIASSIGISVGTVRSRLSRGRKRLQLLLRPLLLATAA